MVIALITSNKVLIGLLKPMFQQNNIELQVFNSMEDMGKKSDFLLRVTDYSGQKVKIDDALGKFSKIFEYPLRLGRVFDEIQHILKQISISEALEPIKMGKFCLNPKNNTLVNMEVNEEINLTEKEQSILLYLHSRGNDKTSRMTLLDHVWQYADGVETHTLETHIYRLRQKIEKDPTVPEFLMTDEDGYYLSL